MSRGWQVSTSALETRAGRRVRVQQVNVGDESLDGISKNYTKVAKARQQLRSEKKEL